MERTLARFAAYKPEYKAAQMPNFMLGSDWLAAQVCKWDYAAHHQLTNFFATRILAMSLTLSAVMTTAVNLLVDTANTVWEGTVWMVWHPRAAYAAVFNQANLSLELFARLVRFEKTHFAFTNHAFKRSLGSLLRLGGFIFPLSVARLVLTPRQVFLQQFVQRQIADLSTPIETFTKLGKELAGSWEATCELVVQLREALAAAQSFAEARQYAEKIHVFMVAADVVADAQASFDGTLLYHRLQSSSHLTPAEKTALYADLRTKAILPPVLTSLLAYMRKSNAEGGSSPLSVDEKLCSLMQLADSADFKALAAEIPPKRKPERRGLHKLRIAFEYILSAPLKPEEAEQWLAKLKAFDAKFQLGSRRFYRLLVKNTEWALEEKARRYEMLKSAQVIQSVAETLQEFQQPDWSKLSSRDRREAYVAWQEWQFSHAAPELYNLLRLFEMWEEQESKIFNLLRTTFSSYIGKVIKRSVSTLTEIETLIQEWQAEGLLYNPDKLEKMRWLEVLKLLERIWRRQLVLSRASMGLL